MERLGGLFARFAQRILPDPMVIACGLTLLVMAAALVAPPSGDLASQGPVDRLPAVAEMWFAGIWNAGFLVFALQMCVVLLTGYGLAKAPVATRVLHLLASRVGSNRSAVFWVTLASCVGCWINWGFGLIAAGILATRLRDELGRKGVRCQYALIVAGAYAGMMIWHGGLSGSAPLRVAREGVTIQRSTETGSVETPLPAIDIGRTTLSSGNAVMTLILVAGVPLLLWSMASTRVENGPVAVRASETEAGCPDEVAAGPPTFADRINRSRVIPLLIVAVGVVALVVKVGDAGRSQTALAAINLNFVNTVFLLLGLLLHRNLAEYVAAVAEGGRAITGIVLQFPLYSGIQGIMVGSGIAVALSGGFVDASQWAASMLHVSSGTTFPAAAFFSAGLVNLFVPSGGGQWIVQGPILCSAADAMGLSIEQTVMAVSYGDQWTNMIQPFWAIPLMGLTGVNVRQFMGYCALLMLVAAPVFVLGLVALY